jgi:hypothetical protein
MIDGTKTKASDLQKAGKPKLLKEEERWRVVLMSVYDRKPIAALFFIHLGWTGSISSPCSI